MNRLSQIGTAAALFCLTFGPGARADDAASSKKVVQDFFASWSTGDVDKVMSFVGDDIRYENVPPLGPDAVMTDKAKMKAFLTPFFDLNGLVVPMKFHTEIKRMIADDQGGVAVERVDHQIIAGKDYLNPVGAFFTVKDGKVVSWTDYFDGKTLEPVEVLMTGLAKDQPKE